VNLIPTAIPDVLVIEPKVLGDRRGYFFEAWKADLFTQAGVKETFVQDNQSSSSQGVLRGLHYQIQQPQGKLVRVISGAVFDVAVDIRQSSPTFGQWVGQELSAENHKSLWVPPGFAHGFYVLSEQAEFIYKCTDYYAPQHERVIRFDDSDLGIDWPLIPGTQTVMSDKDLNGTAFQDADYFA
jgi:dTDP-4-dehydrorhamnose 3,5-epimerase